MNFKNTKIDLFGSTYRIKYVDKIDVEGDEVYGITDSVKKEIRIAKTINNIIIKPEELLITLLHELIHAILMSGQYMEDNDNEALVEWIARCLNLLINKKII